jgi:hypothetical protein
MMEKMNRISTFLRETQKHSDLDPSTYDREFFQQYGLARRFEIDLTEAIVRRHL